MPFVRTLALLVLLLNAVTASPQTINSIVPNSAPSWSRVLITGTGLDAAGLRVQFPGGSGTVEAPIVRRAATELEVTVPVGALSGSVVLTLNGVTQAQVAFSVATTPALTRVRTVVARQHDPNPPDQGPGLALINDTSMFVTDPGMHQIYLVGTDGSRTLYAGTGLPEYRDGPRLEAAFKNPRGLAYDAATGVLYVASTENRIRKITPDGIVSTLAGSNWSGHQDGTGANVRFNEPAGLALDTAGNVYVAEPANHAIRRVTPAGVVTTVAGGKPGYRDGADPMFRSPRALAFDGPDLLIADSGNRAIRRLTFTSTGVNVTTIVQTTNSTPTPRLENPGGLALDGSGTIYVTDAMTHQVFTVTQSGVVTLLAGLGVNGLADGPRGNSKFDEPGGIVYAGHLYVQDWRNRAVRSIESDPVIRDLYPRSGPAGGGSTVRLFGHSFIPGTEVRFGGTLSANITIVSPTLLTAIAPAGTGTVDVTITTPTGNTTLVGAYTYATPPVISSITPASGRVGSSVTINGSGFDASALVFFGSAPAAITSQSSTQLIVTVPSAAVTGPITVTTTAGSAQSPTFTVVVLNGVTVTPGSVALAPGGGQSLSASATYSDGTTQDVTMSAAWQSSATAIANVTASGNVTAIAEGTATVTAAYGGYSGATTVTVTAPPPTDPNAPPPLDPTVPTDVGSATRFLYEGTDPVQEGVPAGTIEQKRAAVLKGVVRGHDGLPIADVRVTVLGHIEYGWTFTRADGSYDLVVNGGGKLTVTFTRNGFLPVHRAAEVPWQDYVVMDDVALTALDSAATTLTANAPSMQIARGSMSTDSSGSRRPTILLPAGTQPTLTLPDGTQQQLSAFTVRATEYTVGAIGVAAMPADLPPASGYTYCVELSLDEALTAGATSVEFSQPVAFYVENFLGMPVGGRVPLGTYDRQRGSWVAEENGRVVRITAIDGLLASVDTDGDGVADNTGLATDERTALATIYTPGTTLWRVAMRHFSPKDPNWPYIPNLTLNAPDDASFPRRPAPRVKRASEESCPMPGSIMDGSIIGCWNQTLGEQIPITGTPFALTYNSARVPGRSAGRTIEVSLTGTQFPQSLKRVELTIGVAGNQHRESYPPAANLSHTFTWDGKDAYGRTVADSATANIEIAYVYDGTYTAPAEVLRSFGIASLESLGIPTRAEVRRTQGFSVPLESWDARAMGFGGWTLSGHQRYDFNSKVLLAGDGSHTAAGSNRGRVLETIAGDGNSSGGAPIDSAPSRSAIDPRDMAVASNGDVYFSEDRVIRRLRDGVVTRVAGDGTGQYSGDGGPALDAGFSTNKIAMDAEGTLYLWDASARRIRRIRDGIIATVAGNGGWYNWEGELHDNIPATEVATFPRAIDVGPDGFLYVMENDGWVRRLGSSGTFERIVRFPTTSEYYALAVGRDGSVYVTTNGHILRASVAGSITRIAGRGVQECSALGWPVEDGVAATAACFWDIPHVEVDDEGNVYSLDTYLRLVRVIGTDGVIRRIAGNRLSGTGTDPAKMYLERPFATAVSIEGGLLSVAPDGNVYFAERYFIRRAAAALPSFDPFPVVADSRGVYAFDNLRHARTYDPLTGTLLYQYGYTSGYLTSVTDANGRVTLIVRDAGHRPTAIISPGGRETRLLVNGAGYLEQITHPDLTTHRFTYHGGGLLASLTNPRNFRYDFLYDADGLLQRDTDPATGYKTLIRTENQNGHTVTTTTGEGRSLLHTLTRNADGGVETRIRDTAGLESRSVMLLSGLRTTTSPEGVTVTRQSGPDPRWGVSAPIVKTGSVQTPGGRTMSIAQTRTVTLSDPLNMLSLTQQIDRTVVNGKAWTTTYTTADRKLRTTSPLGRAVDRFLDAKGRVSQVSVPGMLPVTMTYDTLGRPETITHGARTTTFGWNTRDELASVTDALARTTSFTYDDGGRIVTQTLPGNRVVRFGYDNNGNLTSLTPPGRAAHTMTHTPVDHLAGYTPPGTDGTLQYGYNRDRQLTTITRSDGKTITYTYHSTTARLESIGDGTTTFGLTYDEAGRVRTVSGPGAALEYWYDGSLLTGFAWSGPISAWLDFEYDDDLRLTRELVNDVPITFGYDSDGILTTAGALTITPDPANGRPTGTSAGTVSESITYEPTGEPKQTTITVGGVDRLTLATTTRDDLGRALTESETFNGVTNTTTYGYDPEGRLQTVHRNGTLAATYGYDANGNRTSVTKNGQTTTATYDANQDRLLTYGSESYTYTPNGELRTKTNGTGTTTYTYDSFGNLRTVALPDGRTIEYAIDGQNRRVGKKINGVFQQGWLYSAQLRIAAELDGSGQVVSRFIYGTRSNVPDLMIKSGITYRILSDQRGSPVLVVDTSSGETIQYRSYDEFGNITADTNPALHPFGFAGGLYDSDTGLTRFGSRDYDPHGGRWTARDPIGFAGGDANLYGYVLNDPINLIDPMGTDWVDTTANVSAGIGDAALFGFGDELRAWTEQKLFGGASSVDRCSGAYRISTGVTSAAMLAVGTARVGYAAGAKGIAIGAKTVDQAVTARNALKVAGRLGLNQTARVYSTEQILGKYGTAEAAIAAAGRTNTGFNAAGGAAIVGAVNNLLNQPECGCR